VIASLLIRFPLSRVKTSPWTFLIFDCFRSASISSKSPQLSRSVMPLVERQF
jgi:hypothetical protein